MIMDCIHLYNTYCTKLQKEANCSRSCIMYNNKDEIPFEATQGLKFDNGKPRWELLPLNLVEEIVKVLTMGAEKYAPENWRKVENAKDRYYAALMRHIKAYRSGELVDGESGLSHLAHAACNIMFLYELQEPEIKLTC